MQVPASEPLGEYRFRLLVASVARPDDEYDASPPVSFSVSAAPAGGVPVVIVVMAVSILVIGGGGFALFKACQPRPARTCDGGCAGDAGLCVPDAGVGCEAFAFLPRQDRTEPGWSGYKTLVGDVNGDGRADLIWNSTADANRIYVGLGNAVRL